jgi:hypothetical protein
MYVRLDGGLNTKTQKQWLLDNETPSCLNVVFTPGAVETRYGSSLLNTASVGTFACDGLYTRHDSDGSETMTAWFGGSLYRLSGTTFVQIPSAASVMTAGILVSAAEYEDNIFFGNGNVIPYKYNGSDFTRHGAYPPTATMTAATGAGSYLSGVYYWAVTYVNSNLVESDLSPIYGPLTLAGTGANLSSLPVAPQSYGVASRNIYRTETSSSVFYKVANIANNTATTYTDNIADTALGAQAPNDNGVPPKYSCVLQHNSRLFMIGSEDNFVWYSEAGNPYVVKSDNFRRIGDETGEIPKALGIWDNYLVVFCQSGQTWVVYMPDNDDSNWVDFRVRSNFGSKSPFGSFQAMNKLIFPATENGKFVGFGAMTAAGTDPEANATEVGAIGSNKLSDKIEPDIKNFNSTYVGRIASIVYQQKAYISYHNLASSYNNRILVLDFSNENIADQQKYTWVPWSGINVSMFCVYGGNLYGGCSEATGYVHKLNDSSVYSDNGSEINSYFYTKEFYGLPGHESWHKDFRFVQILYEPSGSYKMGFVTKINSDSGDGYTDYVDLTPSTSLWGTLVFGSGSYEAGRTEIELKKSLGEFSGKRIQFGFSNLNTAGSKFKIQGISIRYNLKGER